MIELKNRVDPDMDLSFKPPFLLLSRDRDSYIVAIAKL